MAADQKTPPYIEEYEGNEPTGIEADPEDDPGRVVRPYDPTKIRVDPKAYFLIRQVLDMIDDGELDLVLISNVDASGEKNKNHCSLN